MSDEPISKANNSKPWLDNVETLTIKADCTKACTEMGERARREARNIIDDDKTAGRAALKHKTGGKPNEHVDSVKSVID